MELTIIEPLKIQMPDGLQKFNPGQRVTLPDDVGHRLLKLAPGKVQRVTDEELAAGQNVLVQIPTDIKGALGEDLQSPRLTSWEGSGMESIPEWFVGGTFLVSGGLQKWELACGCAYVCQDPHVLQ